MEISSQSICFICNGRERSLSFSTVEKSQKHKECDKKFLHTFPYLIILPTYSTGWFIRDISANIKFAIMTLCSGGKVAAGGEIASLSGRGFQDRGCQNI